MYDWADEYAFYKKAINLVRRHGEVTIYFKDSEGYMRRRKIRVNRKCFVSHLGAFSECWGKYVMSCFILNQYIEDLERVFQLMWSHDNQNHISPLMMEWGKGRNKKRIEYVKV